MTCLKCGRDLTNGGVFCESCLETMAKYPVKSNTPLQLPRRKEEVATKKPGKRKHQLYLEEQVVHQKRLIRSLVLLTAMLFVSICLLIALVLTDVLTTGDSRKDNLGKNYTTTEIDGN